MSNLVIKIKHNINLTDLLSKAVLVAKYAIKNRMNLSSKNVSHIGLPSAISNQILRKYGKNKRCKKINPQKIKLIAPNQSIKIDNNIITITPLKIKLLNESKYIFIKINQSELDFQLNNYCEGLKEIISEKAINELSLKNSKILNECHFYKIDFRLEYDNFLAMWLKKFRFENQILSVDDKHLAINIISFDCFVEKVYNYIINVLEFDLEIESINNDSYFFSKDISSWSFQDKIYYDSDSVYLLFRNNCSENCFAQYLKNKILNVLSEKNLKQTFNSLLVKIELKSLEDIRNLKKSTKFSIPILIPDLSTEAYQTLHNMLYSHLDANNYDFEYLANDVFELHFTAKYNEKHTD